MSFEHPYLDRDASSLELFYSFPPFPLRHNIPQCFLGPALVAFDLLTSKRNIVQPSGLLSYDRESGRLGFLFWMHLRM